MKFQTLPDCEASPRSSWLRRLVRDVLENVEEALIIALAEPDFYRMHCPVFLPQNLDEVAGSGERERRNGRGQTYWSDENTSFTRAHIVRSSEHRFGNTMRSMSVRDFSDLCVGNG